MCTRPPASVSGRAPTGYRLRSKTCRAGPGCQADSPTMAETAGGEGRWTSNARVDIKRGTPGRGQAVRKLESVCRRFVGNSESTHQAICIGNSRCMLSLRSVESMCPAFVRSWLLTAGAWCLMIWPGAAWPLSLLAQQQEYPLPPEAVRQPGTPVGVIQGPFPLASQIYPGTQRDYWVYVPAQYDAQKPACVMIVQDGLNRAEGWKLPEVMDNLIHTGEMPVTIGVFVNPGVVPPATEHAQPRFNRSFEYDSLGDRYARFLLEELLPAVSKDYNLSTNPNDRALAGASSGAICAFNAAWERPDAFRRVLSTIGTYVGLRGGNQLPMLVRQTEPKPLRIFLQDGSNDLNIYAGDWWVANQDMYSALKWAGYDVQHAWGTGGHDGKHAAAIMPQALRWLWRDWPAEIPTPDPQKSARRIDVLIGGQTWREVSSGHEIIEGLASNAAGEVFFCDAKAGRLYQVTLDGKTRLVGDQVGRLTDLDFGPQDQLLAIRDGNTIVSVDAGGAVRPLLQGGHFASLVALPNGLLAIDDAKSEAVAVDYDGTQRLSSSLPTGVADLVLTPDHAFVHLVAPGRQMTWHARLRPDSLQLEFVQDFGFLHMPYGSGRSGASDVAMDDQGHAYVASAVGVQVLDQLGRVNITLLGPSRAPVVSIAFGGPQRDHLFATDGGRVFARQLKARGVRSCDPPTQPPRPRL
ncbi:MAG: gluconolactonase [Planctomycetota bacterium]|nr:MAG: gluconolactonase [Planctomycetota bacterium]